MVWAVPAGWGRDGDQLSDPPTFGKIWKVLKYFLVYSFTAQSSLWYSWDSDATEGPVFQDLVIKRMNLSCLLVLLQFTFLFAKSLSWDYQFIPLTGMQWGHQVSDLWSLLLGVAVCLAMMLEAGFVLWGTPGNASQSFWGTRGEMNCPLAHRPLPVCIWLHKVTVPLPWKFASK